MNAVDEWDGSPDPNRLLDLLGEQLTLRKARLFTVGYCRLNPKRVTSALAIQGLELLEKIADGKEPESRLREIGPRLTNGGRSCELVRQAVIEDWCAPDMSMVWTLQRPIRYLDLHKALPYASQQAGPAPPDVHPAHPWHRTFQSAYFDFLKPKVDLLRCLFANPLRPVNFSTEWRTDTVLTLARTMYESREFSAMPILADALQDAGCDEPAILDHCRDTSLMHVRGCWVTDLVLGKQ